MSLDGRIATVSGQSQWITSEESRLKVHRLRDRVSAIMVGINTVLADNPSLTTRLPKKRGRNPIRIVADSSLRIPLDAAIFNSSRSCGVIVATRKDPPADRRAKLEQIGAKVMRTSGTERVDIADLLYRLYRIGVTSLLIEGGAELAWSAFHARVVDRCMFFYAPIIIGGTSAPSGIEGRGINVLQEAPRLVDVKSFRLGPDILLDGRVVYPYP